MAQRPIVVVGAGKTGLSVARHYARVGTAVLLTDRRSDDELSPVRAALDVELGDARRLVAWETGGHRDASFLNASLIVLSPGVPPLPGVVAAAAAGVKVTGEMDLAAQSLYSTFVGITGTNGKSTVTALTGAIAVATGKPTFVGGNLGTPLTDAIGSPAGTAAGVCVVEMSSYQLETLDTLIPTAAAILNITPDHLDRYGSMEGYADAKLRIATNMAHGSTLVLSGDDEGVAIAMKRWAEQQRYSSVADVGQTRGPSVYRFHSSPTSGARLAFCEGHDFVLRLDHGEERYPRSLSHLMGAHNDRNVLASLLLMRASGLASPDAVREGLSGFHALAHRMELVAERAGIRYYDDSKATNVDSVVAGLAGFPVPFALIAGGRDKGGSYAPLVAALKSGTCRGVITIGEAAPLIEHALAESGLEWERAHDLADGVRRARARVHVGEAVVLSPACSSFDMFRDYAHRGAVFKEAAEQQS